MQLMLFIVLIMYANYVYDSANDYADYAYCSDFDYASSAYYSVYDYTTYAYYSAYDYANYVYYFKIRRKSLESYENQKTTRIT